MNEATDQSMAEQLLSETPIMHVKQLILLVAETAKRWGAEIINEEPAEEPSDEELAKFGKIDQDLQKYVTSVVAAELQGMDRKGVVEILLQVFDHLEGDENAKRGVFYHMIGALFMLGSRREEAAELLSALRATKLAEKGICG